LQSYVETDLPNLKTFSDVWTKYTYGEVDLYGIEFTDPNAQTLYSTLKTDPSRVNFVMLHGQTSDSVGKDKINLSKLRDRNIDYLALGHIHSFSEGELDRRGKYCYSGCLEGRGFDETGKKGFVLLTVDGGVKSEFIPFSRRTVAEYTVDMTGTQDVYEGVSRAKNAVQCAKSDLVRIVLKGEIDYSSEALQTSLQSTLESGYYVVSVKDNTTEKIDPARYLNDTSLAGEFVRGVMADPKYEEEYKKRIIALGLKVLSGREVDE
jgi:DNA repair exonuclease SbcCD nuclease subunit